MAEYDWQDAITVEDRSYLCGYCGKDTAPSKSYRAKSHKGIILICSKCSKPTFIDSYGKQTPKARLGAEIQGISNSGVAALYDEARECTAVGAYTAAVMVCRKILMNLAVDQKADEGKVFTYYVDYLADNGYVPPQGRKWVDAIRKRGNEANHEIEVKDERDAKLMLDFTSGLLRFNYELPSLLEEDNKLSNP